MKEKKDCIVLTNKNRKSKLVENKKWYWTQTSFSLVNGSLYFNVFRSSNLEIFQRPDIYLEENYSHLITFILSTTKLIGRKHGTKLPLSSLSRHRQTPSNTSLLERNKARAPTQQHDCGHQRVSPSLITICPGTKDSWCWNKRLYY